MKNNLLLFLEEKQLAENSRKSYVYDIEQFLKKCQYQITSQKLTVYSVFLQELQPRVQQRKRSVINQFLAFLYEKGELGQFYKIKPIPTSSFSTPKMTRQEENLACLWEKTEFVKGQVIALLIVEFGLLPSEMAKIRVVDIDQDYHVMSLMTGSKKRVFSLSSSLYAILKPHLQGTYLFDNKGKSYSRQWFYNRLAEFADSIGRKHWTAKTLRDQHIINQLAQGKTLDEIAKQLGLTSPMSLGKYREWI